MPPRADHFADLVDGNLEGLDPRSVLAEFGAGGVDGLRHLAEDMQAAVLGLGQRDLHDLFGDAGDLDVHLQRGDAAFGAGHLEVHVAEMILVAEDVGEDGVALVFQDQAHGDARRRPLQRHSGVHQRQRRTAHRRHRRRTIRLRDLGDQADRVGEFVLRRQHRMDGAPGELAVADLTAARCTDAAGFADREGREIVVQQERFFVGPLQRVDELLVLAGAERRDHQRLGLAAGEQRRAVGARQQPDFANDLPNRLDVAAVDALAGVENIPAHDLGFELLENAGDRELVMLRFGAFRKEMLHHPLFDRGNRILAVLLAHDRISRAQVVFREAQNLLFQRRMIGHSEVARLLGGLFGELDDRLDHRLVMPVTEHHGAEHDVLGQLFGFRFHHHHGVLRAGDDEVELALRHLVDRRIEHVLIVDEGDARGADRAHERRAGERERRRSRNHRHDIGIVLLIVRQHGDGDLRIAAPAFGEQRTDRPIDQARGERILFSGAAFALEVAARNPAGGVIFFGIVDGQRKEIDAFLGLLGRDDGGEHGSLAVSGHDGAVSLARDFSGL